MRTIHGKTNTCIESLCRLPRLLVMFSIIQTLSCLQYDLVACFDPQDRTVHPHQRTRMREERKHNEKCFVGCLTSFAFSTRSVTVCHTSQFKIKFISCSRCHSSYAGLHTGSVCSLEHPTKHFPCHPVSPGLRLHVDTDDPPVLHPPPAQL